ncbi:hypothetical protein Acr_00g0009010 [Actinidia rufa]|uniref:AT hook motif-containing protein n=1 Tax=Actinidia rufa TaxID=165716 RepID=A0A7J0D8T1_9ERIC|nr:hypothetical protein Acr_00g0009010 [Actinidia rufa]
MSQQNKRANTSTPSDPLAKRKRGRPRKDENLVPMETSLPSQPPPSDDLKSNQQVEVDQSDGIDDDMVGQVVYGVIEGSFDAGYFLSIRTTNSETVLRGVVFRPGRFIPITEANDVAPQAKLYKRRNFPLPVVNPQGPVNGSFSQSEKHNMQSGSLVPVANQSASNPVPPTNTLPKNESGGTLLIGQQPKFKTNIDSGASLGGKDMPHVVSEDGLGNQFPLPKVFPFCDFGENQFSHQLRSGVQFPLPVQSASSRVPLTNASSDDSLGGKNLPLQNSESAPSRNPFPLSNKYPPLRYAAITVPPTDSLTKNNPSGASKLNPFSLATSSASLAITPTDKLPKNNSADSSTKEVLDIFFESSFHNQPVTDQSKPVTVPPSDNLPKNDQKSEFGLENLSTSLMDSDRITEQDEIKLEASMLLERPKVDVEGTKDVMLEIASELTGETIKINQSPQVQHQAIEHGHESSNLAHSDIKSGNIKFDLALVDAKPSSQPLGKPISPKNDAPQIMPLELANISGRDRITEDGNPVTDAAKNTDRVSQSETELNDTGGSFQSLTKTN